MITACIITKNQHKTLQECLECLSAYDLDIVVVDTGSTDESKKVAEDYTDKIYDFPWVGDFAAAKNFAINKAESDMVFVVDTDEFIDFINMEELASQVKKCPNQVGRIKRINPFESRGEHQEAEEWLNRIFNKNIYHYEGKIHEQVVAIDGSDYETYETSVVMTHGGYNLTDSEKKKKSERNIELLELELERYTNEHEGEDLLEASAKVQNEGAYILYQLGKSYYLSGQYEASAEYFEIGLSFDLDTRLEYVIDMVETFGYALLNSKQGKKALILEAVYEEFSNSADFCFLMGLIYMNNERYDEAVIEFEKATTFKIAKVRGANSFLAYYNAGVIRECQKNIAQALKYYKKCGMYEKSLARIQELENK